PKTGDDRSAGRGRPTSGGSFSRNRPARQEEIPAEPRTGPAPTAYAGSSETIQASSTSGASRPAANRRPSERSSTAAGPRRRQSPPRPAPRPKTTPRPPAPGKAPPAGSRSTEVPPRKRATARIDEAPEGTRIQKVLSEAGIASRRAAEDMIRQGRVIVNGDFADLGQRIDPAVDRVEVDNRRVQLDPTKQYFLLNKPEGVITTTRDPEGRTTVLDVIGVHERVFPVGRLDIATEGLLLLTNDGELTHRLTHPSFEVTKTYVAEVSGTIGKGVLRKLTQTGVDLGEKEPFKADAVKILGSRKGPGGNRSVVELEVHEGPKHLVRRVLEAVDRPVLRLVRTGMGPIKLGRMTTGTYRHLTQAEVDALYREVGL
ncbi:MAG: pseudouridine synthase, partial [Actinomycetota bacterium]